MVVEDGQPSPQRPPEAIAALHKPVSLSLRLGDMDLYILDSSGVIRYAITSCAIVHDVAEDFV